LSVGTKYSLRELACGDQLLRVSCESAMCEN